MALDRFKYYKIRLDRIDMSITTPLTAKEGAVNGNGIELQIINGSIIENTTSVAVYLNWKHRTTGVQGSEPFTLADAATGLYRVSYPTEMLTGGLVDADIKVVDGTSIAVSTSPILIKVAEAVTDSTTQSENAWNDIQTILVSQQQLKALFEQAIAGVTVDSEVITARQSTVKGKTFTTLDARLEDVEGDAAVMATNLVTNGDFSNGTTGWVGLNGTIANESGRLAITPTAQFGGGVYNFNTIVNNVYYIAILIEGTIGNNYINVSDVGATNIVLTQNTQRVSIRFTSTQISRFIRVADSRASGWAKFFVDNFLIIDLTTLFGAGNEPTKEQMDKLLSVYPNSWFNGTSEIGSIGALMRATLGAQVVTPTLLNSRTGTAQYVVSNDGLVIFRGTASGGSLNTNIFVLPENIRPAATRTFPISANGAFGVVTVLTNGEVRQTVGALTNVFLDGIAFKVGV